MKLDTPEADYDELMRKHAEPHQNDKSHLCYLYDKPQNLELMEMRGYEPVTVSIAEKAGGQAAKRLVKVGDSVLSRLPIEVHKKREELLAAKTHRMRTDVRDSHRSEMAKVAAQTGQSVELSTGDIRTEVGRK